MIKTYGNEQNDIKYLDFLNDANPFKGTSQANQSSGPKQTYFGQTQTFKGEEEIDKLLFKIKAQIKKDRIRLGEFF